MINVISIFVSDAHRNKGAKIMSDFNGQINGPKLITEEISKYHSIDLYICEYVNGVYQWNFYLPTISTDPEDRDHNYESETKPDNFFINHLLFKVSRVEELRPGIISRGDNRGVEWHNGNYKVYFGNMLVEDKENLKYLPKED